MKKRIAVCLLLSVAVVVGLWFLWRPSQPVVADESTAVRAIEKRLEHLTDKLGEPRPGEWLYSHEESGQSFAEYVAADPVRKSERLNFIAICLVGDFSKEQQQIIEQTNEYLEIFFQVP